MALTSNNCSLYYHTKTPIGFLCRQGFNLRSLIQSSEILPVELVFKWFVSLHGLPFFFYIKKKRMKLQ